MSDSLRELVTAYKSAMSYRKKNKTQRYPKEFKEMVARAHDSGISVSQIYEVTGMNLDTLKCWAQKWRRDATATIPVEWVGPKINSNVTITMPSGIKLDLPIESLNEAVLQWMVKAS